MCHFYKPFPTPWFHFIPRCRRAGAGLWRTPGARACPRRAPAVPSGVGSVPVPDPTAPHGASVPAGVAARRFGVLLEEGAVKNRDHFHSHFHVELCVPEGNHPYRALKLLDPSEECKALVRTNGAGPACAQTKPAASPRQKTVENQTKCVKAEAVSVEMPTTCVPCRALASAGSVSARSLLSAAISVVGAGAKS